jgi:hypothetical protein
VHEPDFKLLLNLNKLTLHKFLQESSHIYGFSSKCAIYVLGKKLKEFKKVLKDEIILKFYIQCKNMVQNEHIES